MEIHLPDSVISPEDLKELINDIRRYSQWYAQYDRKQQVTGAAEGDPPAVSIAASQFINEHNSSGEINEKVLDELIKALEAYAETAPKIKITLAAPIPGSLKKALIEWCRTNISPKILAEFDFNSYLLGGMVVQYGSHIYDWSFRPKILANREKFTEILRNV